MERGLHDEHDYDADRHERLGHLSRRGLLRLGGATGAALALHTSLPSPAAAVDGIVKPTPDSLFIPRGTNAEMRWEAMRGKGYETPVDGFFVRNHTSTPAIDVASWRLGVFGSGLRRELSLSYDDLLRFPTVTVTRL